MKLLLAVLLLPQRLVVKRPLHLAEKPQQQHLLVVARLLHQPLKPRQLLQHPNKLRHQLSSQRLPHNPHSNPPAIRATKQEEDV